MLVSIPSRSWNITHEEALDLHMKRRECKVIRLQTPDSEIRPELSPRSQLVRRGPIHRPTLKRMPIPSD